MNGVDDAAFEDLLESVIAMMDDARHEANVAVGRGELLPSVALQLANRLQDITDFMGQKFPSQWKVV